MQDLFQTVADVKDRDPLRVQRPEDAEQIPHLLRGERGGGFVHDDHIGREMERARNLDHALFGRVQFFDPGQGIDRKVEPVQ